MLIFRPEGSIVYFNAEHIRDSVLDRARSECPPPRSVICDLSSAPIVDLAGAEMLKELEAELRGLGSSLHLVEARSQVRDKLRLESVEERTGRIDRFTSVADAVDDCLQESRSKHNSVAPHAAATADGGPLGGRSGHDIS